MYGREIHLVAAPARTGVPARALFEAVGSGSRFATYAEVAETLRQMLPGSSALLASSWGAGRQGGHAYLAVNVDGEIHLMDAHTGQRSGWPPHWGQDAVHRTAVGYLDANGDPVDRLDTHVDTRRALAAAGAVGHVQGHRDDADFARRQQKYRAQDPTTRWVDTRYAESLGEVVDNVVDSAGLRQLAEDLSGRYGPYCVRLESSGVDGEVFLAGEILWGGEQVGKLQRRFGRDTRGDLVAFHTGLNIDDTQFRGRGFSKAFAAELERYYMNSGVDRIETWTHGKGAYACARAGFTWDRDPVRLQKSLNSIKNGAERLAPRISDNAHAVLDHIVQRLDPEHPRLPELGDLADLAGPDEPHLGCRLLDGATVYAVKYLQGEPLSRSGFKAWLQRWIGLGGDRYGHAGKNCARLVASELSARYGRDIRLAVAPSRAGTPAWALFETVGSGARFATYAEVAETLRDMPSGSSAVLASRWSGGQSGGYAHLAVNDGGEIYHVDPHTGHRSGWPPHWGQTSVVRTAVGYLDASGDPVDSLRDVPLQLDLAAADAIGLVQALAPDFAQRQQEYRAQDVAAVAPPLEPNSAARHAGLSVEGALVDHDAELYTGDGGDVEVPLQLGVQQADALDQQGEPPAGPIGGEPPHNSGGPSDVDRVSAALDQRVAVMPTAELIDDVVHDLANAERAEARARANVAWMARLSVAGAEQVRTSIAALIDAHPFEIGNAWGIPEEFSNKAIRTWLEHKHARADELRSIGRRLKRGQRQFVDNVDQVEACLREIDEAVERAGLLPARLLALDPTEFRGPTALSGNGRALIAIGDDPYRAERVSWHIASEGIDQLGESLISPALEQLQLDQQETASAAVIIWVGKGFAARHAFYTDHAAFRAAREALVEIGPSWPPLWGERAVGRFALGNLNGDGTAVDPLDGSPDESAAADHLGHVKGPQPDGRRFPRDGDTADVDVEGLPLYGEPMGVVDEERPDITGPEVPGTAFTLAETPSSLDVAQAVADFTHEMAAMGDDAPVRVVRRVGETGLVVRLPDGQERYLEFDVDELGTDSEGRRLLGVTTLGRGEADRVTLDRRSASDPNPEVARTQRVWLVLHEVSHTLHEVAADHRQGVVRPCLRARTDEHAYLSFRYNAADIEQRAFYTEQLEGVRRVLRDFGQPVPTPPWQVVATEPPSFVSSAGLRSRSSFGDRWERSMGRAEAMLSAGGLELGPQGSPVNELAALQAKTEVIQGLSAAIDLSTYDLADLAGYADRPVLDAAKALVAGDKQFLFRLLEEDHPSKGFVFIKCGIFRSKARDAEVHLLGRDDADKLIRERAISVLVGQWAMSSNATPFSHAFQEMAAEEFGPTEIHAWRSANWQRDLTDSLIRGCGPSVRRFLRTQYELTQDYLRRWDIDTLLLTRGMGWRTSLETPPWAMFGHSDVIDLPLLRPLSSWSAHPRVPKEFTDRFPYSVVIGIEVPRRVILSMPRTGMGCLHEWEFVVLANKGRARLLETKRGDDE